MSSNDTSPQFPPKLHKKEEDSQSLQDGMIRETFILPQSQASRKVNAWMTLYPSASYWSRIESWEELTDDTIRLTMTRLPSAD